MQSIIATDHRGSKVSQGKLPCPSCTSSDAYHLYDDGHGYCFSCKYLYLPNKKKDFILEEFTYEYVPWRHVSKETMKFYDVKTKVDNEGKPISLGYKYPNDSYKVRLLDKKEFYTTGEINKGGLYGRDRFSEGSARYVTITEGELDALSLHQAVGGPVVSVQSSSTALRDCSADRAWLNSFERIYLAFDGDELGRQAVGQVVRLFDPNKVWVVKFTTRKDANEYLQHGEADQLKKIWWNSKQYRPEKVISYLEEFEKILDQPKKIGLAYPFKILTDMTAGIRTGETVLITAQEKVGKTELMHAILHEILEKTDDNVAAFFLEEHPQRLLQSLAGIELRYPIHLPDRDRPKSEILAALKKVVKKDDRLHVYSHFGSDDLDVFLDTIRFLATARQCRYILFDHITMVVSGILGGKGDERTKLEYFATKLAQLIRELDVALLMVSHVNDFGQTRGSHYLTKVCDIRIDARRDLMHDDPVERNTTYLSIPISRYPGITGECGGIIYDRETNSFTEKAANDNEVVRDQSYDKAA